MSLHPHKNTFEFGVASLPGNASPYTFKSFVSWGATDTNVDVAKVIESDGHEQSYSSGARKSGTLTADFNLDDPTEKALLMAWFVASQKGVFGYRVAGCMLTVFAEDKETVVHQEMYRDSIFPSKVEFSERSKGEAGVQMATVTFEYSGLEVII